MVAELACYMALAACPWLGLWAIYRSLTRTKRHRCPEP